MWQLRIERNKRLNMNADKPKKQKRKKQGQQVSGEQDRLDRPVDRIALSRALARLEPRQREAIVKAEDTLAALEELFHLARRLELGDSSARAPFIDGLRCAIGASGPPDRPQAFTLKSIGAGKIGLPFPFPAPGPQFPCFVLPDIFGPLTRAIVSLALEQGEKDAALVDDAVWAGLWAVFDLHRKLEPLALLHRASLALEEGQGDFGEFQRAAAIATGGCGGGANENLVPLAGSLPLPSLPGAHIWFDHCRAMGWAETERAVRCFCGETYHIAEIRNCTPGREPEAVACEGECIEIRGHGFGDRREWTGYERESQVLFQGEGRRRIAAARFLPLPAEGDLPEEPSGWSDTRIRVEVPAGAVRGDVSLRVLCKSGAGGRHIDPAECHFPTRLRSRTSQPFLEALGPPIAELNTEYEGISIQVQDERPHSFSAEACAPVHLNVLATNAETVVLRDNTGATIPLDNRSLIPTTVRASVPLTDRVSRTFTLTVDSRCLEAPLTRTLTLNRPYKLNLVPGEQTLTSGGTGLLQARVSCPLPEGGSVRASIDNPWAGVTFSSEVEETLEIPPGSDRSAPVPLTTESDLCGTTYLRGELVSGSDEDHGLARARVQVDPVPLDLAMIVDATVRLSEPFDGRSDWHVSDAATFTAHFPVTRSEFAFTLPEAIPIGPVIVVRPDPRRIAASYDANFGHFEFTLSARLDTTVPFVEGSDVTINLSSRVRTPERFGRPFPQGSCLGCEMTGDPSRSFYVGRAVGEGELVGGTLGGRRIAVALHFRMPARPPRTCGNEPPG
jgi:hypothetical protein